MSAVPKMYIVLQFLPDKYRSVTASLLPLNNIWHNLIIRKVSVAVEMNCLTENGSYVLRITAPVAKN